MGIVEKTATELIIYIRTSAIQNKFRYMTSISMSYSTYARQRTPVDGEESCLC